MDVPGLCEVQRPGAHGPAADRLVLSGCTRTGDLMVTTAGTVSGGTEIGGQATVAFVHGTGQVDNDVVFEWDFDGDGDFDQSVEDFTEFLVEAQSRTGRDFPSQINGKAGPGRFTSTARNDDNRFGQFNTASPLNTPPFSTATGRTLRVRTETSTPVDPVLLAKDRFNGGGALGLDELGNTWTDQTIHLWTRDGTGRAVSAATIAVAGDESLATVDIGVDDCYLQATVDDGTSLTGGIYLIYRFTDTLNFGLVGLDGGILSHYTRVAGVETLHETYTVPWPYAPATIGVLVNGANVTGYLSGVSVFSGATALASSATKVGIESLTRNRFALDFRAWDTVPAVSEGVLWAGDVTLLDPESGRDHDKTARITAVGRLAKLATQQVQTAPYLFGTPTGLQVGEVLSAAGLLQPPGLIDLGDVTTGAVAFPRDNALELARKLEETEIGFLHEMQEGPLGYEERSARAGVTPASAWSNVPGAQFRYEEIRYRDSQLEVFNRALAGLAPRSMSWPIDETNDSASTAATVQNDVSVTMPTVAEGDLILVVIASTVNTASRQWLVPNGWKQLINESDAYRLRVYAKRALGTEGGTNVTFYDDVTPFSGGLWIAEIFTVPAGEWFGSLDGVVQASCVAADVSVGDPISIASNPPVLVVPWGTDPTFFVVARAGLVSVGGGTGGTASAPAGYQSITGADQDGASNAFDISFHLATKIDQVETEDPGPFGSVDFGGYVFVCSTTIAVRGWNGDPPLGNTRQVLQTDNLASQDRHDVVRTYPTIPELFGSAADADAYADRVTALYGADRPLPTISFTANKTAAYRQQAIRRRVGDMIHLIDSDSGVDADFYIESVAHRWSEGGLLWVATWELSPA